MNRLVLLVLLAGCLESSGPELGPRIPACVPEDSDPEVAVSYRTDVVATVLMPSCYRCHTPDGRTPSGITQAGFDMSTYASLRAGGANSGAEVVIAGDPCRSIVMQKSGEAPPFGARMPRGGPYLEPAELQLVADWISEGAADN